MDRLRELQLKDMLNEIKKVDVMISLHSSNSTSAMLDQYKYLRGSSRFRGLPCCLALVVRDPITQLHPTRYPLSRTFSP